MTAARGALVERDGRVVLEVNGDVVELSAMEIFKVAVRGSTSVRGIDLDPLDSTCPKVRFHQQAELVGVQVTGGDTLHVAPAISIRGEWTPISLACDHVLVADHWFPIERSTALSVETWLSGHAADGRLGADAYVDLYRRERLPFDIDDRVDDDAIARLTATAPACDGLNATLYPYQEIGVGWLKARADQGIGGLLGDEMGLGKTLQLIGLLSDRLAKGASPHLVIVPLTLMENWRREFAKFAPSIGVYRHQGASRTRRPAVLAEQEVVLTTYDTAVIDEPVLSLVRWDAVVLDEAQAIKNPETQRSQAIKSLPRAFGVASTGTPLENRTQDVWSLLDFVHPGYLGTRAEFAERLEEDPVGLRLALRPLMLRREVSRVAADLPPLIQIDVALEMFGPEGAGYDALLESASGGRGAGVLAMITRLRQYTAHRDALEGRRPHPTERSAKFARLLEIADEIVQRDAKAIVFVAFHEVADLIRDALSATFGVPAWSIDGRTPVGERQAIIDRYSAVHGAAFLVLNPVAAGVGLNIQAATHVVHYTLEWNPAREAQATARAWRRGQEQRVTVHRLFYTGTIDEAIVERLQDKRDLFDEVVAATPDGDSSLKALLARAIAINPPTRQESM